MVSVRQPLGYRALKIDNSWCTLNHASYVLQLFFAAIAQTNVAPQPQFR